MKRCLSCHTDFAGAEWACPNCGRGPEIRDGVPSFAPELAIENDGMSPDAHDALDRLQHGSFWFRGRNRLLTDMVRRHVPAARSLMEIGCGTGYVLAALTTALPEAEATGSEIYANGLGHTARRLGGRAKLLQMDARSIPFTSEFDLIAACDVLEHIEDDKRALSEMHRALRPGGSILLTVPQHPFLWSQSDVAARHKRRYRVEELAEKVRDAKFHIVRDTSFVTMLMPLLLLQRLIQGRKQDYDPNQEFALPGYLDRVLELLMEIDRWLIGIGLSLPIGGSRLILARRQ